MTYAITKMMEKNMIIIHDKQRIYLNMYCRELELVFWRGFVIPPVNIFDDHTMRDKLETVCFDFSNGFYLLPVKNYPTIIYYGYN